MNRKLFYLLISLLLCCQISIAQSAQKDSNKGKSELQQQAEAADKEGTIATARYKFIRAFEDYANRGLIRQSVECGVRGTQLYYKESYYNEAFDLLRRIDQTILAKKQGAESEALYYLTTKERLNMYLKMRRSDGVFDQLNLLEQHATASKDKNVQNDLLYQKAICYYTFGQNAKGDAVFKEMAGKLTASKEYDKVDKAYQTLIDNGRKSGSANLVAQSYRSYIAWKDSANAMKLADVTGALKQQIADNEAVIADKDSSLTARNAIITGLAILAVALAIALLLGALVLLRYIVLTRKQKNTIRLANDNNALKAKFISSISEQMTPTLKKLDQSKPEVKALLDFAQHVQTLSALDNAPTGNIEAEETHVHEFCEELMNQIRQRTKKDITLTVNAPQMSAKINREYVSHILLHLLNNATEYVADGGKIVLDFKKRSAHSFQFLVWNTGEPIPAELREDVFKPFREVRDLTTGDGLGLPICKQMALKMDGDLYIDPEFSKGTRFVLALHE